MKKKPFEFDQTVLTLDWFDTIHHVIDDDDYTYYKLDRRFGPSWWLYGMKTVVNPTYHWEETEIGEISYADLIRFVEWAKTERGSKIVDIHMLCGSFDIFNEIGSIVNKQLKNENENLRELNEKAMRGLRGICKECKNCDVCKHKKGSHFNCWQWKHET